METRASDFSCDCDCERVEGEEAIDRAQGYAETTSASLSERELLFKNRAGR